MNSAAISGQHTRVPAASAVGFLCRCAQPFVTDSYIARVVTGMIMVAIEVDAEKMRYTVRDRGATAQDKVERELERGEKNAEQYIS